MLFALRRLALAGLLLLAAAGAHAAPGVNLRWNACFGDGGASNRNFACNTNTGTSVLPVSFVLGEPSPPVTALQVTLELAFAGTGVPAWWSFFTPGHCRQTGMSTNGVISPTAVACVDWAEGTQLGSVTSYQEGVPVGPNSAQARIGYINSLVPVLAANTEYFALNIVLTNIKTVGTGACDGCTTPACLLLHQIRLNPDGGPQEIVVSGATNFTDSNYVTWQGGAGITTLLGNGCPRAVPVRRETWGAVKALYR